jgi:hypothetical protein
MRHIAGSGGAARFAQGEEVRVQQRRVRLHCFIRIQHHRQRLVFDFNELQSLFRFL